MKKEDNVTEAMELVDAPSVAPDGTEADELSVPEFLDRTSDEDEILAVAEVQVEEDLV